MSAAERPNLLWIMADQLRYQALSSSGDPNVHTPNIDRLVAEGVRCTTAVSQYPICVPYRAGLVTGLHATHSGTLRHGDYLHPDLSTVAHAFNDRGYRTSWVGKWHLAPVAGASFVTPEGWIGQEYWVHPDFRGGFQDWHGFNISNNYFKTYVASGERIAPEPLEGYQTDALTDRSIRYLAERPAGEPWFHVVSYESPHPGAGGTPRSPLYPVPVEYEARFEPSELTLRDNVPAASEDAARVQLAGYYRLIENLDDNIGRLLDALEASGQAERTVVAFFSDHGEMGGSHGRRHKHVPYAESMHVPLVWRGPGLPRDTDYEAPICGLDIFPTSAGLCGVPVPAGLDGRDHAAALAGGGAVRDAVLVQWETPRFDFADHPYRAIRSRTHTYVVGRDEEFCLLFEHASDPWEQRNLFDAPGAQGVRAALHARMLELMAEADDAPPAYLAARAPGA